MIHMRKKGLFYEDNYGSEDSKIIRVDSIVPYLNDVIEINNNVTLEDFFNILEKDEELIDIIFSSYMGEKPIGPYIEEVKKDCPPEGREDMDCIECIWVSEQFDYRKFYEKHKDDEEGIVKDLFPDSLHEPRKDDVNEIDIYIDVAGWGKHEFSEEEIKAYGNPKDIPSHIGLAIEFIPLYRLKHLPIRLNKKFVIKDQDDITKVIIEGEKEFTIFELFGAILSELTLAGLPEDRDEKWKNIVDDFDEDKENEGN